MNRILEAVNHFKDLRGLVIGDLMLDVYSFGSVERISPEAPVPVVRVEREEFRAGGAGNVAGNLGALGARVFISGVIGDDTEGRILIEMLEKSGVNTSCIVKSKNRKTIVKNRIVSKGQQLLRIDREKNETLAGRFRAAILEILEGVQGDIDFIILEDYNKGLFNGYFYREIISRSKVPVFVDPKYEHFSAMKNAFLVKPNFDEFKKAMGLQRIPNNVTKYLQSMKKRLYLKNLVVTRGENGMMILDDGGGYHIPSLQRNVYDVTGAGDTVISVLGLSMSAGLSLFESAILATIAAGIEITKLGAQPIYPAELKDGIRNHWSRLVKESSALKVQS